MIETFLPIFVSLWGAIIKFDVSFLGCPKITPCEKCLAPHAFSGAKFQV